MSILQRIARPVGHVPAVGGRGSVREVCLVAAPRAARVGDAVAISGRRYQAVTSEPVGHADGRHYWHLAPVGEVAAATT